MSPIVYKPPGISVEEQSSPAISSSLTSTQNLCLVGESRGYQIESQQITIASGVQPFNVIVLTSGETFNPYSSSQIFLSVTNAINPVLGNAANQAGYAQGVDFSAEIQPNYSTVKITPTTEGALSKGGIINFTYQVNSPSYFEATRFFSQSALEAAYGPAFNSNGIETPLSAAAYFAFEGGAQSVIAQPLFELENAANPASTRKQPTGYKSANIENWKQTLYALRSIPNLNFVIPVVGQSLPNVNDATMLSIEEAVQDYLYYMEFEEDTYIQAILGEDSSDNATYATDETLRAHAETLRVRYGGKVAQNLNFIAPSTIQRPLPTTIAKTLSAGAQYVAATLGGLYSSSPVNTAITRRIVPGWTNIPSYRDRNTKNADAQAGLMVLENNAGTQGTVIVRHAITVDDSSFANQALNIVRAKFLMLSSLIQTLNEQVVGQIIVDGNAPMLVVLVVTQVLQALKNAQVIVNYSGIQASLVEGEPTRCQIAFSWLPAFPLDYLEVGFSVDLTNSNALIGSSSVIV